MQKVVQKADMKEQRKAEQRVLPWVEQMVASRVLKMVDLKDEKMAEPTVDKKAQKWAVH